jgi:hypothetical protein
MSQRTIRIAVAGVIAIAIVIGVRHYFSPGEVVKRKLVATIDAFHEERLLTVMSSISRTYSDPWGNDYELLAGYLNEVMDTYDDLDLDFVLAKPVVADDEVQIGIEFVLSGRFEGTRDSVLGTDSQPCTATVVWRKERPGWRLVSTSKLDIPELREELNARRKPEL